jgi:hypothetical protein
MPVTTVIGTVGRWTCRALRSSTPEVPGIRKSRSIACGNVVVRTACVSSMDAAVRAS